MQGGTALCSLSLLVLSFARSFKVHPPVHFVKAQLVPFPVKFHFRHIVPIGKIYRISYLAIGTEQGCNTKLDAEIGLRRTVSAPVETVVQYVATKSSDVAVSLILAIKFPVHNSVC